MKLIIYKCFSKVWKMWFIIEMQSTEFRIETGGAIFFFFFLNRYCWHREGSCSDSHRLCMVWVTLLSNVLKAFFSAVTFLQVKPEPISESSYHLCMETHTRRHTCTHMHAHAHTNARTRTHKRRHTHVCSSIIVKNFHWFLLFTLEKNKFLNEKLSVFGLFLF